MCWACRDRIDKEQPWQSRHFHRSSPRGTAPIAAPARRFPTPWWNRCGVTGSTPWPRRPAASRRTTRAPRCRPARATASRPCVPRTPRWCLAPPPDGYILGMASSGPLAINPSVFSKLSYNPIKDFTPISLAFIAPLVLLVNNELPARNVAELVALLAGGDTENLPRFRRGAARRRHRPARERQRLRRARPARRRIRNLHPRRDREVEQRGQSVGHAAGLGPALPSGTPCKERERAGQGKRHDGKSGDDGRLRCGRHTAQPDDNVQDWRGHNQRDGARCPGGPCLAALERQKQPKERAAVAHKAAGGDPQHAEDDCLQARLKLHPWLAQSG